MKKFFLICFLISTTQAMAKTMSSATLELRGVVPETASVATTSLKSDLDLRLGSAVTAIKIGRVQIKANSEISGIFVSSNTKTGIPENAENQPFKLSRPFILQVSGGCKSLKTDSGIVLSPQEKNIATTELTQLNLREPSLGGVIENCDLSASWSSEKKADLSNSQNVSVNSGLYSMSIVVTLVSQ